MQDFHFFVSVSIAVLKLGVSDVGHIMAAPLNKGQGWNLGLIRYQKEPYILGTAMIRTCGSPVSMVNLMPLTASPPRY